MLIVGVNFTIILRAAFAPIFLRQKSTCIYKYKKLQEKLSYEQAEHKMLVKLTDLVSKNVFNS
jgi:hypothetical protein